MLSSSAQLQLQLASARSGELRWSLLSIFIQTTLQSEMISRLIKPSFTNLKVDQYLQAGEKELNNPDFYDNIVGDPTLEIRNKCIELISNMQKRGEISEKVADYLMSGDVQLSNFYHLIKTHSLPTESQEVESWLEEKGFPIRGIISGRGGPNRKVGRIC